MRLIVLLLILACSAACAATPAELHRFQSGRIPKKVTLVFSIEQGWEGLVAADDQVAVTRMVRALEPLKARYNVCVLLNPMVGKLPGFRHTLDTLAARGMPFMFDVYSSDTLTLGPWNTPADQKHGVSISLPDLAKLKRDYGPWLVGLRFHEIFAEDFTVRTEKTSHPGWLPATLPLPDDDFFQPKMAEGFIRFAKEHGMFVQWSDWHWLEFAPWDEQQKVREADVCRLLRKYPGIVTVTYANNEPNEDSVKRLETWDASIRKFVKDGAAGIGLSNQTWLRRDETKTSPEDMIAWSRSAMDKGARIIQFEPAWWFFRLPRGSSGGKTYVSDPAWADRGQATENFLRLRGALLGMKGSSGKTR